MIDAHGGKIPYCGEDNLVTLLKPIIKMVSNIL
jgi:hypothetical protein